MSVSCRSFFSASVEDLYFPMTPTARKLVDVLKKSCRLTTQKDFEAFADAVTQLRRRKSADVLRELLRCFRDVEAGEVQYELVEACEEYPSQMVFPYLLKKDLHFTAVLQSGLA